MHLAHEICKIKHLFIVYNIVVVRSWSRPHLYSVSSQSQTKKLWILSQDRSGPRMRGYH